MKAIFMDESGCMGFDFSKKKTSKYFILTFLITENPKPLEKIVKKIFSQMTKVEIKSLGGVLHAHKMKSKTKTKILKKLSEQDFQIFVLRLNKQAVHKDLKNQKQLLYNNITSTLLDRFLELNFGLNSDSLTLYASQRETKSIFNKNFCEYVGLSNSIMVEILKNNQHKCLQLVDLISWSLFRKYEFGDDQFYEVIKSKIVSEDELFK